MNTHSTQYHPHEYLLRRDEYRGLLRRSVGRHDPHQNLKCGSYDNERGWKNYDWLEHQTERNLTAAVWGVALLGAIAIVVGCVAGYQTSIISAVTSALSLR